MELLHLEPYDTKDMVKLGMSSAEQQALGGVSKVKAAIEK